MAKRPHLVTAVTEQLERNGRDKWQDATLHPDRGNLRWNDCPPEELRDAVAAATEDGAAVLLSKTSDGGALCVQVWQGTSRAKFYAADAAQLNELLQLIEDTANSR